MTQIAIDSRLTLVAFEAMNHWKSDGGFGLHVFHKNNELAGYCSVLHAMQSVGITGIYGRRLRAAVIGFGATARGAVHALNAHGVDDVRVLTNRDVAAVGSPIHSTQIIQMGPDPDAPDRIWADTPDGVVPVADLLADNDIVVNCVLQDPDAPLVFVTEKDLAAFTAGSLIVDVSCDVGMGFSWAQPTSFVQPIIEVANGVHYYAVDHSPSYPVELGDLGDQRGVVAPHRRASGRPGDVGQDSDDRPGDRDPRRCRSQSAGSCRFSTATMPIRMRSVKTATRAQAQRLSARSRFASALSEETLREPDIRGGHRRPRHLRRALSGLGRHGAREARLRDDLA